MIKDPPAFGHPDIPGEYSSRLYDEFAARLEERTGKMQIFPGEQPGKEIELVRQVRDGVPDITGVLMPAPPAPWFVWLNGIVNRSRSSGLSMPS